MTTTRPPLLEANDSESSSIGPPGVVERWWAVLGTPRALRISIGTVLLYRLWLFLVIGRIADPTGDEAFYWRSANTILRIAHIHEPSNLSLSEGAKRLIANGWFLPGMSGLLTPVRLISSDISFARGTLAILSFLLLLLVVRRVWQMFSPSAAVFTLLVVGLLPYTAWFSMALWGGHIGGLIMVLNLLWTIRLCRVIRSGGSPAWSQFAMLGVAVAACVYIRPTTLGQVFPIAVLLFLAFATHDGFWIAFRKSVTRWALMFFVFSILFAPWTIGLMLRFDGPFFVVTSRPLAEVIRNASDEDKERVGTSFGVWHAEIQRLMIERNQGYYDVVTSERDRVNQDYSTTERLNRISFNMRRFYDEENQFVSRAFSIAQRDGKADNPMYDRLIPRYLRINSWAWAALTVLTLYALMRRWAFWQFDGWLGIVMRASMAMALFQPVTGGPHGRHISFVVVLFVVSGGLALDARITGKTEPMPTIRWPRVERLAANGFSLLIAAFAIFYFAS